MKLSVPQGTGSTSQSFRGGTFMNIKTEQDQRLVTQELTIRFGGHTAVDNISTHFDPGTLTAIVGPNGAGKTTFFNLLSGQLKATSGQVLFKGENITRFSAAQRTHMGLGRAFQLTNLFPDLTVLENVRLAVRSRRKEGFSLFSLADDNRVVTDQALQVLETVSLVSRANDLASELPHGDQRKLEVGLLIALKPRVFMFDEPTAGMSVDEAPVILELIKQLKSQPEHTIIMVEHKMSVVRSLSDRILVFHNGALVADGEPDEVIASPIVQEAYLGVSTQQEPDAEVVA